MKRFRTSRQPIPYSKPRGDGNVVMFTSLSLILLAFFILLYALSSPKDDKKQQDLAFEIKKAFQSVGGLFSGPGESLESGRGKQENTLEVSAQVESMLQQIQGYVEEDEDLKISAMRFPMNHFVCIYPLTTRFLRGARPFVKRRSPS